MKVFVYYNLRKKVWSVKDVKTGLVIAHLNSVVIKDATFKVSEAGRQRVLKEKRKNVHAGVQGILAQEIEADQWLLDNENGRVDTTRYNPYKYKSFVFGLYDEPIHNAEIVKMECSIKPTVTAYRS